MRRTFSSTEPPSHAVGPDARIDGAAAIAVRVSKEQQSPWVAQARLSTTCVHLCPVFGSSTTTYSAFRRYCGFECLSFLFRLLCRRHHPADAEQQLLPSARRRSVLSIPFSAIIAVRQSSDQQDTLVLVTADADVALQRDISCSEGAFAAFYDTITACNQETHRPRLLSPYVQSDVGVSKRKKEDEAPGRCDTSPSAASTRSAGPNRTEDETLDVPTPGTPALHETCVPRSVDVTTDVGSNSTPPLTSGTPSAPAGASGGAPLGLAGITLLPARTLTAIGTGYDLALSRSCSAATSPAPSWKLSRSLASSSAGGGDANRRHHAHDLMGRVWKRIGHAAQDVVVAAWEKREQDERRDILLEVQSEDIEAHPKHHDDDTTRQEGVD